MADSTLIEWARHPVTGRGATWNIVTGCQIVSPGCTNCYAMKLAGTRLRNHQSRAGLTRDSKTGPVWTGETRFNEEWLTQPLQWKTPRGIFVAAHGDLFADGVTDDQLDCIFAVMALCPQHVFFVLTKRPERMREYLTTKLRNHRISAALCSIDTEIKLHRFPDLPLPNAWLGVSVEDQARADERIPILLDTPAAIRFISAEPLLGPVDISRWVATANVTCKKCRKKFWLHDADPCRHKDDGDGWTLACTHCNACVCERQWTPADARTVEMGPPADWIERQVGRFDRVHPTIEMKSMLDWVIAGGESGPDARPSHPDWFRALRDQCAAAAVPYFFKQWGEWLPLGQSGFTAWHAETKANGYLRKPKGKWLGHAYFNDGAGGHNTHAFGPVETMMIDNAGIKAVRIGKRAAGRLLDGVEHNAMPEMRK